MAAGDLATQEARASAAMVLTWLARNDVILCHLCEPDDIIKKGRRDLVKSRGSSCVGWELTGEESIGQNATHNGRRVMVIIRLDNFSAADIS